MKLKKLNLNAIALNNEMMSNVIGGRLVGGRELGSTQYSYSGGTAADFGGESTDRVTQTWTEDALTHGGYWSDGNSCTHADKATVAPGIIMQ